MSKAPKLDKPVARKTDFNLKDSASQAWSSASDFVSKGAQVAAQNPLISGIGIKRIKKHLPEVMAAAQRNPRIAAAATVVAAGAAVYRAQTGSAATNQNMSATDRVKLFGKKATEAAQATINNPIVKAIGTGVAVNRVDGALPHVLNAAKRNPGLAVAASVTAAGMVAAQNSGMFGSRPAPAAKQAVKPQRPALDERSRSSGRGI